MIAKMGTLRTETRARCIQPSSQSAPRKTSAEAVPEARCSTQRQQQFKPVQARIVKVRRQPLLDVCRDSRQAKIGTRRCADEAESDMGLRMWRPSKQRPTRANQSAQF